ncbi:MAG: Rieske 2Fe-2S domain-containing protein [Bacteroidota bacterium]
MAHDYTAVLWSRQKKRYDMFIAISVVLYMVSFIVINSAVNPEISEETLIIRSTGTLAIILLHVILLIGPLSRLNENFLPLLYNRRHLGVTMFLIATVHAVFSTLQFHAFGNINPVLSIFISNMEYGSLTNFPFQTLGALAWIILFLMAATSHDFWLKNLSARAWKSLHIMVYIAYSLLVLHVMLGVAQDRSTIWPVALLGAGMILIIGVHLTAGFKESKIDNQNLPEKEGFVHAGNVDDIENNRAKVIDINEERVAIFKYDGKLSAVSNVCQHQNGPLGEGRVIGGLITCPWHGYQYKPHDGCSPPPFDEKVPTFGLKLEGKEIYVKKIANEAGTEVAPVTINF